MITRHISISQWELSGWGNDRRRQCRELSDALPEMRHQSSIDLRFYRLKTIRHIRETLLKNFAQAYRRTVSISRAFDEPSGVTIRCVALHSIQWTIRWWRTNRARARLETPDRGMDGENRGSSYPRATTEPAWIDNFSGQIFCAQSRGPDPARSSLSTSDPTHEKLTHNTR